MAEHPDNLHELLQVVHKNNNNIYFRQSVPMAYGSEGMPLDYINAMNSFFRSLSCYQKMYYVICDSSEREELVMCLSKQAVAILQDKSIPQFGSDKQFIYNTADFAMALSAGNFSDKMFDSVKHRADDITKYVASHFPVNGKLDVMLSGVIYHKFMWNQPGEFILSFKDDKDLLGSISYSVKNQDLWDLTVSDMMTNLVEDYPNLRFSVSGDIKLDISDCNARDILGSIRSSLSSSQKQRDARQRILSGKSVLSSDIGSFLRHRDTEYSLVEFLDMNHMISACYAAVYNIKDEFCFIPVVATAPVMDDNPVYGILNKGLKRPFILQDGFVKQTDVSSVSAKISSYEVSHVNTQIANKLKVLTYPAKTIKIMEHHEELVKDILADYKQHAVYKQGDNHARPSSKSLFCYHKTDGAGLMDIDTSETDDFNMS